MVKNSASPKRPFFFLGGGGKLGWVSVELFKVEVELVYVLFLGVFYLFNFVNLFYAE